MLAINPSATEHQTMLHDLQANILKGHVRDYSYLFFLSFNDVNKAKRFLANLPVKSASTHLQEVDDFKHFQISGTPLVNVFLTAKCYEFLGLTAVDGLNSMKDKQADLNDPEISTWDTGYQETMHALILVGDAIEQKPSVDQLAKSIFADIRAANITLTHTEKGHAYFNAHGDGVEHFGYVDGRSQPLFLINEIETEKNNGGIDKWNPEFDLEQVLVTDSNGKQGTNSKGSFFVFRKLEQNVKGFKDAEKALGAQTGTGELVGAQLVGRFEDGTPVVTQSHEGLHPVSNNFNYDDDTQGSKCPFHAHIRKTNPRGDSVRTFGIDITEERSHIMARRGLTYGQRQQQDGEFTDQPTTGVGLLFMAFMADIANQFEFTQQSWANSNDFVRPNTGVDPIIGQIGKDETFPDLTLKSAWGEPKAAFGGFVTFKGGEYFFAPSLSCLKSL